MEQSYLSHIIVRFVPLLQEDTGTGYLLHIIVGLVALAVGWAIGFFDSNRNSAKKIKQAEESAQHAIREAEGKAAEAQKLINANMANPSVVDDPGILRLKNENGSLSLDLDGQKVNSNLLSPEQRKRLIDILNLIRPILEGKPAPAAPRPPASQPQDSLSRLDTISAPRPIPAPPASTPATPPTPSKESKPATSGKGKKDNEPEVAPTSMVGQINAILQVRIANTPLATQGVTMLESPSGGVNVYVGINKYEEIDAVPDEEVKAAIRAAIAEWEKKYTPGL